MEFTDPENGVFGVADSEDLVILACVVMIVQQGVTDGRTDGQTTPLLKLRQGFCIACMLTPCKNKRCPTLLALVRETQC